MGGELEICLLLWLRELRVSNEMLMHSKVADRANVNEGKLK